MTKHNATCRQTPHVVALPRVEDERGNLSYIQDEAEALLGAVRRVYWIYGVPGGEVRGSHAFRQSAELIVALSGSFDVVLRSPDGLEQRFHLNRSYSAVYVPPMMWRTLENFSTNSLSLVLASTYYSPDDYVWDATELARLAAAPGGQSACCHECVRRVPSVAPSSCQLVTLPSHTELRRGFLTAVEECTPQLPFVLRRVFYIYDIPADATRGAHAHRRAWQFIVAASSSFDVTVDDGVSHHTYRLDRPYCGLLVPPGVWCHLHDFSSAAVALVLTSEPYDRAEYITDYEDFRRFVGSRG